ncbi:MAG: hypothetical protein Kow00103_14460 [Candidatus Caldatribacteriota bacterium]
MKNYKNTYFPKIITLLLSLVLIIFLSLVVIAQEIEEGKEATESTVSIEADKVLYDKSMDKMSFQGNLRILQEDIVLTAEEADFDVDQKIGQIKNNIKLVQKDITITGEALEAFLNDKRYIFQGEVTLIQERKDEEGKEDNIVWNAPQLEILADTKDITATGGVKILKKDYTITAEQAVYNDQEQKIELKGKVKIEEGESNRWISGDQAIFFIESERLEVTGNVRSGLKLD